MKEFKKNVHNTGPLGMLLKAGQISKVDSDNTEVNIQNESVEDKPRANYFKTQSGIKFTEDELIFTPPDECEPWKYANRLNVETNIDDLVNSIKENGQLQPGLVRPHPLPHGKIKYEIIFGRRRHLACQMLGIPFLAIRKNIHSINEALVNQDAENKFRKDVSNYSNAILYKRLLEDKVFKTEKELAKMLSISPASFTELMAYTKIPKEIVEKISDIHSLSNSMALKIVKLINGSEKNYSIILNLAKDIGKKITSPAKLESAIKAFERNQTSDNELEHARIFNSSSGKKLFTLKTDFRGYPCIIFDKTFNENFNFEKLCGHIKTFMEDNLT